MKKLKITTSIADFAALREDGYYYVDKTDGIYKLASEKGYYFLSRPRRFGKSLLVDTMQCLFEGQESLFKGLAIHKQWDWSQKNIHPVVRLSFSGGSYTNSTDIEKNISDQLLRIEKRIRIDSLQEKPQTAPERLAYIIEHLYEQTGQRVVVLVDEYDRPILDVITNTELAAANQNFLKGVYGVLKDCMKHIRFVFLTGITIFSKTNMFSGLNNLEDITLDPQYATICGFTGHELDTVFAPELKGLDRQEIRDWYNGYSWDAKNKVYNPHSILSLFRSRKFNNWWFKTGTPTYLYQIFVKKQISVFELDQLKDVWVDDMTLSEFNTERARIEALLFQSGYLTIEEETVSDKKIKFNLRIPNFEVRQSLYQGLLTHITKNYEKTEAQGKRLVTLLGKGEFEAFEECLGTLLNGISHDWYHPGNIDHYEGVYAVALYTMFADLQLNISAEDTSSHGRADMVLIHAGQVFVLELKMVKNKNEAQKALDEGMQQIQDRKYGEKYKSRGEPIHLIALAFGIEERNIVGMKRERLV